MNKIIVLLSLLFLSEHTLLCEENIHAEADTDYVEVSVEVVNGLFDTMGLVESLSDEGIPVAQIAHIVERIQQEQEGNLFGRARYTFILGD